MSTGNVVRWNVTVSKETDVSLRSFLASQGMKRGELSRFVEQAVLTQVFHRTIEHIHQCNRDADPADIEAEINEALGEVRREARSHK